MTVTIGEFLPIPTNQSSCLPAMWDAHTQPPISEAVTAHPRPPIRRRLHCCVCPSDDGQVMLSHGHLQKLLGPSMLLPIRALRAARRSHLNGLIQSLCIVPVKCYESHFNTSRAPSMSHATSAYWWLAMLISQIKECNLKKKKLFCDVAHVQ
jgi:hypothetical protein